MQWYMVVDMSQDVKYFVQALNFISALIKVYNKNEDSEETVHNVSISSSGVIAIVNHYAVHTLPLTEQEVKKYSAQFAQY